MLAVMLHDVGYFMTICDKLNSIVSVKGEFHLFSEVYLNFNVGMGPTSNIFHYIMCSIFD